MVDSSVIYNVIVNFQVATGAKAEKIMQGINKTTQKTGKIFDGINKLFKQSAVRLFSLIFLMRRMQQAVSSLLQPAAQMSGIMDVLNMTLGLFFLPIMLALLPTVLMLSDLFLSMPDSVKILVGAVVLLAAGLLMIGSVVLGAVVGLAALGGGSVVVGIGVLTAAFSALGAAITASFATLTGWLTVAGSGFMVAALGIIAGIILVLFWLNSVKDEMGGWGPFFENVGKGIMRIFVLLAAGIVGALGMAWDLVKQGWNAAVQWMADKVNVLIDVLNAALAGIKKIADFFGKTFEYTPIAHVQFEGAKANTEGAVNAFKDAYDAIMEPYLNWEQSVLKTPTLDQVAAGNAQNSADQSKLAQIDLMKKSGMDNASIINALSGGGQTQGNQVVLNQTNNIQVADWQTYQKKMQEQLRQQEADIKRQLASGQV